MTRRAALPIPESNSGFLLRARRGVIGSSGCLTPLGGSGQEQPGNLGGFSRRGRGFRAGRLEFPTIPAPDSCPGPGPGSGPSPSPSSGARAPSCGGGRSRQRRFPEAATAAAAPAGNRNWARRDEGEGKGMGGEEGNKDEQGESSEISK